MNNGRRELKLHSEEDKSKKSAVSRSAETSGIANPLLGVWSTPYATPPFDLIETCHYEPALRRVIADCEAEVERIATQTASATFENTIVALERATGSLDRISNLLFNLNECCSDTTLQQLAETFAPELTRLGSRIYTDDRLFRRVETVYQSPAKQSQSEEEQMLTKECRQAFISNGALLDESERAELTQIKEQMAVLQQQFGRRVLAATTGYRLHLRSEADTAGLPEHLLEAARQEALSHGETGWTITLAAPLYVPFLAYSSNRKMREQVWKAYNSRCNSGDNNDTNAIVQQLVDLRRKMAHLLGYDTFCDITVSRRMVGSRKRIEAFMQALYDAALPMAEKDLNEVSSYAELRGAEMPLQPWDMSFYSQRLKEERYHFDFELLRPYLALDKVKQGIFDLYGRLYGLSFEKTDTVAVYHDEVEVYVVRDGARMMGLLYLDLYPREGKRGGAWMTEFRDQAGAVRPLIQVVCNLSRPTANRPALLSLGEVRTLMHEMGHAVHGLLSDVHYGSLSGTHVRRDFVELPSQLMENWVRQKAWLQTFACHYDTGAPMPEEYYRHIGESENFQAGWLCLRQLHFGRIDLAYHCLQEPLKDRCEVFESVHGCELLPHIDGCTVGTAFSHIFNGGYASGYYSYKWAEMLEADVFGVFESHGLFDRPTATRLRQTLLSRGGTREAALLYRDFMGRDPQIEALLRKMGHPSTKKVQNTLNL